jgi:hypothetical protein
VHAWNASPAASMGASVAAAAPQRGQAGKGEFHWQYIIRPLPAVHGVRASLACHEVIRQRRY